MVAPLYAADLLGGCFGSLVASLLLVPVTGLSTTVLLVIPLLASSVLLAE
jgi:CBS-domain-containing membrane protein